jgi:hypothetical protein
VGSISDPGRDVVDPAPHAQRDRAANKTMTSVNVNAYTLALDLAESLEAERDTLKRERDALRKVAELAAEAARILRDAADSERRASRMYAGGVISDGDADYLADQIDAARKEAGLS